MTRDDLIDATDILANASTRGHRGRDWRRSMDAINPQRRRSRGDTDTTSTRREKPVRLAREAARLADLLIDLDDMEGGA